MQTTRPEHSQQPNVRNHSTRATWKNAVKVHLYVAIVVGAIVAGAPGASAVDCNFNFIDDAQDIASGRSKDCNNNGVPDECDLHNPAGSADCNGNGIPDECDTAAGTSPDCNGNSIPDGCEPQIDCNHNGVQDICDIAGGTSQDCNANGIPDECDMDIPIVEQAILGPLGDDDGPHPVAVDGDWAVVGAPRDDGAGTESGAAYVFRWDGLAWSRRATLTASDASFGRYFGCSVSIGGDTAVIGAIGDNTAGDFSGSAYVFRWDGSSWIQEAKLIASDAAYWDHFGFSVSMSGDTAVIGASDDNDAGSDSGSAYVFRRDGTSSWIQEAKLTASDAAAGDHFGYSVSVSGDTTIIGAYRNYDAGSGSGAAYVFRRDGSSWTQEVMLTASDAAAGLFGCATSVCGDTAVIGAYGSHDAGSYSGSAYVFRWDGSSWAQEAKLTASDPVEYKAFGWSVSVSGDAATIGAYLDWGSGSADGAAYLFRRAGSSWFEEAKLTASDMVAYDTFGSSVAISGDTVLIGSERDRAYVFIPSSADCNANGLPDECDTAAGTSPDCNSNSIPDACEPQTDCNNNGTPDICDIGAGTSQDCDGDWVPDECEPDCNANGIADDCDIASGVSGDCNANTVPDDCDIDNGSSVDVDSDGVPDECEADCNRNGIPDDDDMATGTSQDCNGTGIPDECDILAYEEKAILGPLDDRYGYRSVAVDGHWAVVGASDEGHAGPNSGAAYVFHSDGLLWTQQCKLTASDAETEDEFGYAVSISGDTAVIGASGDDDRGSAAGAAYVFRWNGSVWVQQAKLIASDAAAADGFGASVSVSGDTAVIGASGDDDRGSGSGSAYVFRRDGSAWIQQAKLTAADGATGDTFGYAVSVDGATVLIGAFRDNDGATDAGSAYVFRRDGSAWIQQAKLIAADGAAGDHFGCSVSVSGDTAIVAALHADGAEPDSGAAYVFCWDGSAWGQQAKLIASDEAMYDNFGWSASVSGDTAVIGAPGDTDGGSLSGSAYVFRREGPAWIQHAKLTASDALPEADFGRSVSVRNDVVFSGGTKDKVYVFAPFSGDCNTNGIPDECDIADGTSPDANGDSVPDECESDCNGNGVADTYDIASGASQDCTGNGIPDECEPDCNTNGVADGCDILSGASPDCNSNEVPDECDVASGASTDINGNGVPDECDPDCNGNGSPDDSDITTGASLDCNGNGVPDECDVVPSETVLGSLGDGPHPVAVDGNWAVVGAYLDDDAATDAGAAYLFRWDGSSWVEHAKLTAPDADDWDAFGYAVSISGDTALIGAYSDDTSDRSGSAYVFRWNGSVWSQEAKLIASQPAHNSFGWSVSLSGDTAVIGARHDDAGGANAGAAYVFRRVGSAWTEQAKLIASDAAASDYFGRSVSVSGDTVVIGADWEDEGGTDAGSAYVFRWNGTSWIEETKLIASNAAAYDYFGTSVSISGDTAVIGATWGDGGGFNSGAAYVFRWNGSSWMQQARLTASDAESGDNFGQSVSIDGDTAVIGAHLDDDTGPSSGSVYIFHRHASSWTQQAKLTPSGEAASTELGVSASVSGDVVFAGSDLDKVFVFAPFSSDCNENGRPDECDPDTDADGFPDGCDSCPRTMPGARVDINGCQLIVGDSDDDNDVDIDDFNTFQACFNGPNRTPAYGTCVPLADFDGDGDVDLRDFSVFAGCFNGSNRSPACE